MTHDFAAFPPPPGGPVPPPPPHAQPTQAQPSGLSTASLVLGIGSLVVCALGFVMGPIAAGLGIAARKRVPTDSKALWGLILGIVGTVLSLFAIISALVTYSHQREIEEQREAREAVEATAAPSADDPQGGSADGDGELTLSEQGVAAAGYRTAYEAWAATYDAEGAWDGLYEGQDIDTPCFSMDGEAWWVTSSDTATCEGQSELWWETYSGTSDQEIKLFGSGGVGAAISIEAVSAASEADFAPDGTVDALADYVVTTHLPSAGVELAAQSETTVSGTRAIVLEVDSAGTGLEDYRMYVLAAPGPYDEAGGARLFLVRVYNEAAWVYSFEDSVRRFEDTFTWK